MNDKEPSNEKLKWHEHLACGWPLSLIGIGGALGGLLGGGAYAINVQVFRKSISKTKKYIYSFLIVFSAFAVYFLIIVLLALFFPDLFSK